MSIGSEREPRSALEDAMRACGWNSDFRPYV
jgi:hypothetical protein